jgi:NAD(P)-dependent dehydrogenase (short-subunit alcohol dehydrogenase family)
MNNPFNLTGKTILVTGASSGIGRAVAISISQMGGEVILSGRNTIRLSETLKLLNDGAHQIIPCELTNSNEILELIKKMPAINGFVSSAGIVKYSVFNYVKAEDIRELMTINYEAPVILTKLLLSKKKIQPNSSIVFISSISGKIGSIGIAAYAGTKGALSAISKVIALEYANKKIRVNCVTPGMIRTPLHQNTMLSDEDYKKDELNYPLGYGQPEDVANACTFLLSDGSKWITGTDLIIDGGFTAK